MPIITFRTNLPGEKIPEDFHRALSAKLAEALGKPKERVSVTLLSDQRMSRGGSLDPTCELHIASIGLDSREKSKPLTQKMTTFLNEQTGVPPARIILVMTPLQGHLTGVGGDLLG